MPDVLTLWNLAVLVVGGMLYLLMSRSPTRDVTFAIAAAAWSIKRGRTAVRAARDATVGRRM